MTVKIKNLSINNYNNFHVKGYANTIVNHYNLFHLIFLQAPSR